MTIAFFSKFFQIEIIFYDEKQTYLFCLQYLTAIIGAARAPEDAHNDLLIGATGSDYEVSYPCNELFNVFPILFHVKVCVGAMLSFQKRKRVTI